jgi:hypothetical protein
VKELDHGQTPPSQIVILHENGAVQSMLPGSDGEVQPEYPPQTPLKALCAPLTVPLQGPVAVPVLIVAVQ